MHDMPGFYSDEMEKEIFSKEIRKGFLKAILLVTIRHEPIHGYNIIQVISEKTGGRWTPSPGSVYPALEYLVSKGYITSQDVERKKVYTVTPKGEQAVDNMRNLRAEMLRELAAFFENL